MAIDIKYNDTSIATLPLGKTVTLNCSNNYMQTDVIVDATNAVSGNKILASSTSNQTGIDVSTYSTVSVSAIATGSAGTPTATKGAVSGNSISVTPSVTNSTGYITGGTKTGTNVTISASELVSGNKSCASSTSAQSGIDVTNYKTVSIDAMLVGISGSASALLSGNRISATANGSTAAYIDGTMTNRGNWTGSVGMNGTTYIPSGYHTGSGYVSGPAVTQRGAWTGNVGVNGTTYIPEGYHNGNGYIYNSTATLGAQTITPSTSNLYIGSGYYLTGTLTIQGDSNLVADNILSGKSIFGVSGNVRKYAYTLGNISPDYCTYRGTTTLTNWGGNSITVYTYYWNDSWDFYPDHVSIMTISSSGIINNFQRITSYVNCSSNSGSWLLTNWNTAPSDWEFSKSGMRLALLNNSFVDGCAAVSGYY